MDNERFNQCVDLITNGGRLVSGIGTYGEKTVHAVLKNYYEPFQDNHEIKIGGYIADAVGEYGILEIQTGNFGKMDSKLRAFLDVTTVNIVFPLLHNKWIIWIDNNNGEMSKKRRSSVKYSVYNIFKEIYPLRKFVTDENLRLRIAVMDMIYYYNRQGDTKKNRRINKCNKIIDRVPVKLVDEIYLTCTGDYKQFIPDGIHDNFKQKDFAAIAGIDNELAGYTLAFLRYIGILSIDKKEGNSYIYKKEF